MKFEMLKDKSSIIKVIGVGGGGGNAVNHMYNQGIVGVDFIICNTDAQALELSPIPNKIQLGTSLTEGRGAGSIPEVGKNSAIESIDDVKELLGSTTKMVFITAGMGGGTGTGASPIIAQAAKEMGILTVGIVTTPFTFEGKRRKQQADEGLESFKKHVDTLLVISNDKLREMYGNLTLSNAFAEADNILTTAAKGIAEIITVPGYINVDFEDVKTVMQNSGVAIMGSASAEGEGRAYKAVQCALASPLLNDNDIEGARYILLNITSGEKEVLMDEVSEITDYIQNQAGLTADIIWGNCYDENLGDKISVTLIATGFQTKEERFKTPAANVDKKVIPLSIENTEVVKEVMQNINLTLEEEHLAKVELKSEKTEEPFKMEIAEEPKQVEIEIPVAVQKAPAMVLKTHIVEESEQVPMIKEDVKLSSHKQVNLFDFIPAPEPKRAEEQVKEQEPFRLLDKEDVQFTVINKTAEQSDEDQELEEQMRKNKERINRLKELSMRLRTPNGLTDLETEPAYLRKKQTLDNLPHSSESQVSRYTINEENGQAQIRPNNPFLHDNVD
ncbi:MAG: cell division protein FtsZ [bacterium]|jgi:cell division protein FtsZ